MEKVTDTYCSILSRLSYIFRSPKSYFFGSMLSTMLKKLPTFTSILSKFVVK